MIAKRLRTSFSNRSVDRIKYKGWYVSVIGRVDIPYFHEPGGKTVRWNVVGGRFTFDFLFKFSSARKNQEPGSKKCSKLCVVEKS